MSTTMTNMRRESHAKQLRRDARDLIAISNRDSTPSDAKLQATTTARAMLERAQELWPEPVEYGDWTTSVDEYGTTLRVRIEGRDGSTHIWLRDAAALAAKLTEYAKHPVAKLD